MAFVPGPTASRASGGGQGPFVLVGGSNRDKRVCGPFVPLEPPTGTKGPPFVPVGVSNWDKRPLSPPPPLARLAIGPGTKATYCPGPKGCQDKWSGTKAYSVVVVIVLPIFFLHHVSFWGANPDLWVGRRRCLWRRAPPWRRRFGFSCLAKVRRQLSELS